MPVELVVIDHPLVATRLSVMRDRNSSNATFRAALHELGTLLVYEALRHAPVSTAKIDTPVTETIGFSLANPPLLVPVLRAGLGFADAAQNLIPESQMGFVGLARDEETHQPRPYMESLPEDLTGRPVLVLDPMIATGGSLLHCLELVAKRGATDITVVSALLAPEGLGRLNTFSLPIKLVTASLDEKLNESAFIVPGLGDAGDRQFGAV